MRLSQSWIIAAKDFKTLRKKKSIVYLVAFIPLFVAILIPAVIGYVGQRKSPAELVVLLPAFLFFYVILGSYLSTPIASYTIAGEKVEKSLEPLLATPTTDSEILLGKGIAAFFPPLAAVLGGSALFMLLMDLTTKGKLGYYYFPDWNSAIVILLLLPLALLMSVQMNVIMSSRVTDVRAGQQLGGADSRSIHRGVRRRGTELDQPRRHHQPGDNRGSLGRGGRAALLRLDSDLPQRGDTDKMEVGASASKPVQNLDGANLFYVLSPFARPMAKSSFEVGEKEKHTLTVDHDWANEAYPHRAGRREAGR